MSLDWDTAPKQGVIPTEPATAGKWRDLLFDRSPMMFVLTAGPSTTRVASLRDPTHSARDDTPKIAFRDNMAHAALLRDGGVDFLRIDSEFCHCFLGALRLELAFARQPG